MVGDVDKTERIGAIFGLKSEGKATRPRDSLQVQERVLNPNLRNQLAHGSKVFPFTLEKSV
ncbi:MAG: hypothetical protein R3F31_08495 [Verrucomicrobiales bacterium]